jgi:4-amino-4-deoxy-L-arabinose transferase-like glycosyltransferase
MRGEMKHVSDTGWILGVALATAVLCLPFLGTLPLFDPDEGYYPAAAAESLAHGHPLDLTLNGEPRWNKPPLSYALMQAGILIFGRNEFAVRLPSVIEGAALVAILGLLVARVAGGRAGLLASVVLASSLGFQVMTRAAHPEMGLVLGTCVAQALFALWFVSPAGARPRWAWWAAGLAMGFGFLAKGPSALAMPALMLLAGMFVVPRDGRPSWGELGRAFGGAALLALVLACPWYLWMGSKHGDAFWSVAFGQMEHLTEERHGGFRSWPFFFVPILVGAFLPWILFLPSGLRALRRSDPAPAARFTLLMALAAGTSFLFWSLSASKNPHYALVFLPPLAAMLGVWSSTATSLLARPPFIASVAILALTAFVALLCSPPPSFLLNRSAMGRAFARAVVREEGAVNASLAIYRQRLPSVSFYADREVDWPHTPDALAEFLRGTGEKYLLIHRRHMDVVSGIPHEEICRTMSHSRPSAEFFLLRFGRVGSPAPPAPAAAPPGGAPPPAGGPR